MKKSLVKEIQREARKYKKDMPVCNIARLSQLCEECNWDMEQIVPLLWLDGALQAVKKNGKDQVEPSLSGTATTILDVTPIIKNTEDE